MRMVCEWYENGMRMVWEWYENGIGKRTMYGLGVGGAGSTL